MALVFKQQSGLTATAIASDPLVGTNLGDVFPTPRAGLAALVVNLQKVSNLNVDIIS